MSYRRNMDESFRKKFRDTLLTRDEKLQLLLQYSARSGIAIGNLEVFRWDHDEYEAKPSVMFGPEREIFRWNLANGRNVTLSIEYFGAGRTKVSFAVREPRTVFGSQELHRAIMDKYHQCGRTGDDPSRAQNREDYPQVWTRGWGLFATGSDLPYPAPPHAYLLPQEPYDLHHVTQILLLEALSLPAAEPSKKYRRNTDESHRKKMRDSMLSRNEKLQALLDHSKRVGADFTTLEVYTWEPDVSNQDPNSVWEIYIWKLPDDKRLLMRVGGPLPGRARFQFKIGTSPSTGAYQEIDTHGMNTIINKYAVRAEGQPLITAESTLAGEVTFQTPILDVKQIGQIIQIMLLETMAWTPQGKKYRHQS